MSIPSTPDPNADHLVKGATPTPPAADPPAFPGAASAGGHTFFPDMPFGPTEWKAFIRNLEQYFGSMIQQDKERMQKASEDMKKPFEED